MKHLSYNADQFNPTKKAGEILVDLELELGVNLCNRSESNPNVVHGFLTTCSNGDVDVYLYEASDLQRLELENTFRIPYAPAPYDLTAAKNKTDLVLKGKYKAKDKL